MFPSKPIDPNNSYSLVVGTHCRAVMKFRLCHIPSMKKTNEIPMKAPKRRLIVLSLSGNSNMNCPARDNNRVATNAQLLRLSFKFACKSSCRIADAHQAQQQW